MSDFVKTWQLGFCLALGTAWLQASAVSKIVGGLWSWSAQLDNPGTALTVGGWIRLGAVFTRGLWWLASTLFLLCPSQLKQVSAESDYHDNCRAHGGGGGCRQLPVVHVPSVRGGEGESLGTKDILSWGPSDTHWSHVYINSVIYYRVTSTPKVPTKRYNKEVCLTLFWCCTLLTFYDVSKICKMNV